MKKLHSLLLSCTLLFSHFVHLSSHNIKIKPEAFAAGVSAATTASLHNLDKIPFIEKLTKKLNENGLNVKDCAVPAGLLTFLGTACYLKGSQKEGGNYGDLFIAGGTSIIAYQAFGSQTIKNLLNQIPVVKNYTCKNQDCKGICAECKLTKFTLTTAVTIAIDRLFNHLAGN